MSRYLELLTPRNGQLIDCVVTLVHKRPERVKHGPRVGPDPARGM